MDIDILLLFTVGIGLLYSLFMLYFMMYERHKERKLLINETIFKLPYTRTVFNIVHVIALIVLAIGIYMAYNYALKDYVVYKRLGPMNDGYTLYGRELETCKQPSSKVFYNDGLLFYYYECDVTGIYYVKKGTQTMSVEEGLENGHLLPVEVLNKIHTDKLVGIDYEKQLNENVAEDQYTTLRKGSMTKSEYKEALLDHLYYYYGEEFSKHTRIEINLNDLDLNKVGDYQIEIAYHNLIDSYETSRKVTVVANKDDNFFTDKILFPKHEYKWITTATYNREQYESNFKQEFCTYNNLNSETCNDVSIDASYINVVNLKERADDLFAGVNDSTVTFTYRDERLEIPVKLVEYKHLKE